MTGSLIIGQLPGRTRRVEVECAQAARDLAASHLAGPTASAALAEGLVAVSLLSADLGTPGEAVTLHIQCDGPLGSMLVEATYEGTLRGYTAKKILNDLDGAHNGAGADPSAPVAAAFGATGVATVMASLPGKVLAQSSVKLMQTPRPEAALAAYYSEGAQREVKDAVNVALDGDGRVATARGALFEKMPGSDPAEFAAAATLEAMEGAVTRPLRFGCRCSREKVLATLAALPAEDRAALVAQTRPIDIYCHMCGKCHTFQPSEIAAP